jgi:hypothetical protein
MHSQLAPTDSVKLSESTASAANPRSCERVPTHSLSWPLIFSTRTEQLRIHVGVTAADGLSEANKAGSYFDKIHILSKEKEEAHLRP